MIRTYSELIKLPTFEERFEYLKLDSAVGRDTFGFDRYLNQTFYNSKEWKRVRNEIIIRDNGCDLGVPGYELYSHIFIHHMNPMNVDDLIHKNDDILNPEFLICVSFNTHNLLHYGASAEAPKLFAERRPNDMCPWRKE